MTTSVVQLISEGEATVELPMPSYAYALIAIGLFAGGLLMLWFFRNTSQKVSGPVDHHGEDVPGTHADTGYDTHTQRRGAEGGWHGGEWQGGSGRGPAH